jgi:hypothetical protein
MEWTNLVHSIIRSYCGLVAGLAVVLAFGYWAFELVMSGHEVPGTLLGTVDLVGLAGVFVLGYQKIAADLANKRDRMTQLTPPTT